MQCVEKKKLSGSFEDRAIFHEIQLSYDGGFTGLSFDGGGGSKCPPPIFIFENHRKSNKIIHCFEKKNFDW